jgi:hypothetical protein
MKWPYTCRCVLAGVNLGQVGLLALVKKRSIMHTVGVQLRMLEGRKS